MDTALPTTDITTGVPPLERPLPPLTPFQAFWERFGTLIVTLMNLSIFGVIWQVAQGGATPAVDTRFIPAPLEIIAAFSKLISTGTLWPHFVFSGVNYIVGFGITIVLGVPLGIFLGLNPTIRNVSQTFTWVGYSMPSIALLPIIVVIMGFGRESKIFIVAIGTIWPILINVLSGTGTLDPVLLKAGRVFGANPWQIFTKITLPYLLPWIMTGIRIASRRGFRRVIIAEIFGSTAGLGYMVALETDRFNSDKAFAYIISLMVISLIIINGIGWLEEKSTPWRQAVKL